MTDKLQVDPHMEQLLTASESDPDVVGTLLAHYAHVAARSQLDMIRSYGERIQQVCMRWEGERVELKGIRLLCEAISKYYGTQFQEVVVPLEEAMQIVSKDVHPNLYGLACMIYGANCRSLGDMDVAVEFLIKGADLIDPDSELAIYKCYSHYQLAEINNYISDHEAAELNYNRAIEIAMTLENQLALFRAYNGMANFHLAAGNYDECKRYLELSLGMDSLSESQMSRSKCDLGICYYHLGEHMMSRDILLDNYKVRSEAGLEDASSTSLIALARTRLALDEFEEARQELELALNITEKFRSMSKRMDCLELLAELLHRTGQFEEAANAYKEFQQLSADQSSKQLQNIYQIKNKQIAAQKEVIEHIYTEVQDSIRYAKRIQAAILPPESLVREWLPNGFVLYKPKDIVAGDFYWMHHLPKPNGWEGEDTLLLAAADCTGHGVPGAMVSVVCSGALDRCVQEFGITDPGEVLTKARELVVTTFEQSEEEVKDGMDVALCSLSGKTLRYAGAHNPLWIVRSGEVLETKADKQPVGLVDSPKPFTTHEIRLQTGDAFYVFSDGLVDQFGGPRGKKFKARAFRELLLSIQGETMEQQYELIDRAFEEWRGDQEQVDDVCVIGVRV